MYHFCALFWGTLQIAPFSIIDYLFHTNHIMNFQWYLFKVACSLMSSVINNRQERVSYKLDIHIQLKTSLRAVTNKITIPDFDSVDH